MSTYSDVPLTRHTLNYNFTFETTTNYTGVIVHSFYIDQVTWSCYKQLLNRCTNVKYIISEQSQLTRTPNHQLIWEVTIGYSVMINTADLDRIKSIEKGHSQHPIVSPEQLGMYISYFPHLAHCHDRFEPL